MKLTQFILKNKGRKIGAWAGVSYQGNASLFTFEDKISSFNYIWILKKALKEIRSNFKQRWSNVADW